MMTPRTVRAATCPNALLVALCVIIWAGCTGEGKPLEAGSLAAQPLGSHECAACGMIVSEQPAPRAQLVHRDGTRSFLCSVGDLLAYADAPSPSGAPVAIHVETLDPAQDAVRTDTGERPWHAAEQTRFVVGVAREGVMGEPYVTFVEQGDAERVAGQHPGAEVMGWKDVNARWKARQRSGDGPR